MSREKSEIIRADVTVTEVMHGEVGEHGEGFLRLALVENEQRIRQAARNLRRFFDTADQQLHNIVSISARA